MDSPKHLEIIFLGDELLLGIRSNGHLVYLGDRLTRHGLPIQRTQEIRDEEDDIRTAFLSAWERSDIVITTGGLGPTTDDLTRETIAASLGRDLVFNEAQGKELHEFFALRGREVTPNNLRQCYVVDGAERLKNSNGTAPGQWLEIDGKLLIMLPGPAHELKPMFEEQVLPRLINRGLALERPAYLQLRTIGVGESYLQTRLEPIFNRHAGQISTAYCAHNGLVDLRLRPIGGRVEWSQLQDIGEECAELLGDGFLGYGTPEVEDWILRKLRSLNSRLAVAESCTGGLLASRFTDVPGASQVFAGGIVCYQNEVKEALLGVPGCLLEQHGAVSAECAVAMATGVAERLEADYAVAITGFAGPEGGNGEPPGTIYIGYHSPVGVWSCKLIHPGQRQAVKQRAVNSSLDFIYRKLKKYAAYDLLECLRC
ncbi:MAG: CinA family nicotinamide mononucleotide deamidase-related protein [Verrucomicrobiota bacterium JB022]|nr:CinA family nicotinamide mononucleotide deamidase-related protein [Verrucomicrobiota bacterium JB022]